MIFALLSFVAAPLVSLGWVFRGVGVMRRERGNTTRTVLVVLITVVLVLVFGGLLAGADAEFAHRLATILPTLSAAEVARAIFCFLLVGALAGGVAFLGAARPTFDRIASASARTVRRVEWVLPLVVLNLLFAVFDYVQVTVLFNPDSSLATKSRAYMRGYAHSGFWQLLAVTVLTLTVLAVTYRIAPRAERADRTLLRVLLGAMAVFSMVIVASAIKRVATYEALYGYTRLRVAVAGIELWLGFVFVLVLVATLTLRSGWLPQVIAGSLVVALLAGAVANPDLYVANRNVERYQKTKKLSIYYMAHLSADAAPAIVKLNRLKPKDAPCAASLIWQSLAQRDDTWRTWNFSRVNARVDLADLNPPVPTHYNCPKV
jgi:hypothetical protein